MIRNNYKPSPSKRKEHRAKSKQTDQIQSVSLDNKHDRINFWSFSFTRVREDTISRKFRVYTKHNIPLCTVRDCLIGVLSCRVSPIWGYKFRNTFDVIVPNPIRWDHFIKITTNALEKYL